MKVLKATGIVLGGPLLGIFIAFLIGGLATPDDTSSGGHGSPGDGFLIINCILVSLLLTVPLSVALAARVLLRKPKPQNQ